jgi:hypothetical protein
MRNRRITSEILWGLFNKFRPRVLIVGAPPRGAYEGIWSNSAEVRRLGRRQFSTVVTYVDWEVKRI